MRAAIVLTAMWGLQQPAYAHWQKTRWAMTIEEAARASGQSNPDVVDHEGSRTKAFEFPYRAGRNEFTARLIFGGPAYVLETVVIKLHNGVECDQLSGELSEIYGVPNEKVRSTGFFSNRWFVRGKGDKVAFFGNGSLWAPECSIEYAPLQTAEQSGL